MLFHLIIRIHLIVRYKVLSALLQKPLFHFAKMSLFQAREWWSTRNGCDEEFDDGCLLVANVDDDPTCKCKLVTGSFNGMLRVFLPKSREFKIEDLLAEEQLEFPILQLAVGKFMA